MSCAYDVIFWPLNEVRRVLYAGGQPINENGQALYHPSRTLINPRLALMNSLHKLIRVFLIDILEKTSQTEM